ncbi:hypothetical protein HDU91_001373, partial [Kappamyces sp. JEL0680]
MFMPIIMPLDPNDPTRPVLSSEIPPSVKQQLFEGERDDLVTLSLKVIDAPYLFLKEDYIRASCKANPMVRYAVYSMGSAVSPSNLVPAGLSNRHEMALIYYERAAAYFSGTVSTPKEIGVLGLLMLSLAGL